LFAPAYHPGVRRATAVRRALKTRTLFNLLGPLANPAHPELQVMGVYDPRLVRPLADTLRTLGAHAALVVHGGGLDEIALHGPTTAALLRDGAIQTLTLDPEDAGFERAPIAALAGGEPAEGAAWLDRLLAGRGDPVHRAAVAINAGALLWIAGLAATLRLGGLRAREIIDSGAAQWRIAALVEVARGA
jgi:anthranilate phosphoribosyltransferase